MISKKNLLIGACSQSINILAPFIVIFSSSKYLSSEQSALWIFFMSSNMFLLLFDFGVSPTITRFVSYVAGGAQKLEAKGISLVTLSEKINYSLLNRLVIDIDRLYTCLAILAAIIFNTAGYFYFKKIVSADKIQVVLDAWWIFSVALVLNVKFLYYTPMLIGLEKISSAYIANIMSKSCWILITICIIYHQVSLINLSIGYLLATLFDRIIVYCYLNYQPNLWLQGKDVKPQFNSTLPFLFFGSWRLGVVSLGGFLINRSTTYLAGLVASLQIASSYTLSVQVYFAIIGVVNVLINQMMPILSKARLKNDIILLQVISLRIYLISILVFCSIGTVFILSNQWLLQISGMHITFLPVNLLLLMGFMLLLEMSHSICASIITTKNEVPFVPAAIISGIGVIILASFLSIYCSMGIFGLILGQMIVQLLYNNWKWPLVLYRDLYK